MVGRRTEHGVVETSGAPAEQAARDAERAAGNTVSLVVMGVSGVGKSTVALALAAATGWPFAEGDDLHPKSNRTKMTAGDPLDDVDRWPWLRRVAAWIGEQETAGRSVVVTCSALRRAYRDLLRDGHPSVHFLHLIAPHDLVATRLTAREDHFMPPSLLASQLDTLEPLERDEPGTTVVATDDAAATAAGVLAALGAAERES